jgi:N,N'-diacetylchitobiose transport system permease protein
VTRVPQTVAGGAVHARRRRPRTLLGGRASTRLLPWLLILPAAAVTLVLVAYPVGRGVWMSFTDADLKYFITGETSWVGLDQYRAIWNDPDLRRSFANTLILGWSAVAGTMLVGCAAGLLLNIPFRGRGVLAVLVLLPWAVPSVAATSTFKYMFNDQYGVINWAGSSLGISSLDGYAWLTGRWSGLAAVAIVIVWQSFPFIALAVLAGLQSVSRDALEAASIDGAGAWSRLRYVVWPALRPLLAVLLILSTIWDFKIFDQLYVMTQGGPSRLTENIPISTYTEGFGSQHYGTAAALSVVLFVLLMLIAVLYMRLVGRDTSR